MAACDALRTHFCLGDGVPPTELRFAEDWDNWDQSDASCPSHTLCNEQVFGQIKSFLECFSMNTHTGVSEALIMISQSKSTLEHNSLPEHFMKDIWQPRPFADRVLVHQGVHQHQQTSRGKAFSGASAAEGKCYHGL